MLLNLQRLDEETANTTNSKTVIFSVDAFS